MKAIKKWRIMVFCGILCLLMAGCATTQNGTTTANQAQLTYSQVNATFLNAWSSYHTVWAALPETDPRKAEWVKKYHPLFLAAAQALLAWNSDPSSQADATAANDAVDQVTAVLLKLSIKGGN
jgi:hypothetical protein